MPSPFWNLLDNGVSHPGIPLSKLGKPVTKLAQRCKWSEKSTKTRETKYSSEKYFNFPNSKQTTHIACNKTIIILFSSKKLCLRFQIQNEPKMEQDHLIHNAWTILPPKISSIIIQTWKYNGSSWTRMEQESKNGSNGRMREQESMSKMKQECKWIQLKWGRMPFLNRKNERERLFAC